MARIPAADRGRVGRGGRGRGSGRGSRGLRAGFSQYGQGIQERSSPPASPPPPDHETDTGELSIDMDNLTVMCYLSQEMIHVSNVEEMADQLVRTPATFPLLPTSISCLWSSGSKKQTPVLRSITQDYGVSSMKSTNSNFYRKKKSTRPYTRLKWYGGLRMVRPR